MQRRKWRDVILSSLCFSSQKTEATVNYNKMIRCVLLHNFSSPSLSVAVWPY